MTLNYRYNRMHEFVGFSSEHIFNGIVHGLMHSVNKDRDRATPVIVIDVTARAATDYTASITQRSADFVYVGIKDVSKLENNWIRKHKTAYIALSPNLISLPEDILMSLLPGVFAVENLEMMRIIGFGAEFQQYSKLMIDGLYEHYVAHDQPDWFIRAYDPRAIPDGEEPNILQQNMPRLILKENDDRPYFDEEPTKGPAMLAENIRGITASDLLEALSRYNGQMVKNRTRISTYEHARDESKIFVDPTLHRRLFDSKFLRGLKKGISI